MNFSGLSGWLIVLAVGVLLGFVIGFLIARLTNRHFDDQISKTLTKDVTSVTNQALLDQQRQASQLMAPLQEALDKMFDQIAEAEKQRISQSEQLKGGISSVAHASEILRLETQALHQALTKPQVRGSWGEMALQRVVEAAGMTAHVSFATQVTGITSQATIRPDMTIFLGEGKVVFVDAKVPLGAYLDARATSHSPTVVDFDQVVKQVKTHINQLSTKQYWSSAAGSPEFVVLFLPSDALLIDSLANCPDLLDYAGGKDIVLASPSTLIALLKTVAFSWRQANLSKSAGEVLQLGRQLYSRVANLAENFDKLGRSLDTAVLNYNKTLGSLESRVLVSGRRFRDLDVSSIEIVQPCPIETPLRRLSADEMIKDTGN